MEEGEMWPHFNGVGEFTPCENLELLKEYVA